MNSIVPVSLGIIYDYTLKIYILYLDEGLFQINIIQLKTFLHPLKYLTLPPLRVWDDAMENGVNCLRVSIVYGMVQCAMV